VAVVALHRDGRGTLEQGPEAGLAGPQAFAGLMQGGDVAADAQHSDGFAGLAEDRRAHGLQPFPVAVRIPHLFVMALGGPGLQGRQIPVPDLLRQPPGHDLPVPAALHLRRGTVEQPGAAVVAQQIHPVRILQPDQIGGAHEQGIEQLFRMGQNGAAQVLGQFMQGRGSLRIRRRSLGHGSRPSSGGPGLSSGHLEP
jgi:hypothetical protein